VSTGQTNATGLTKHTIAQPGRSRPPQGERAASGFFLTLQQRLYRRPRPAHRPGWFQEEGEMSTRKASLVILLASIVVLVGSASPGMSADVRSVEEPGASPACASPPAQGSGAQGTGATSAPCFLLDPVSDIQMDALLKHFGSVAYGLLRDEYLVVWSATDTVTGEIWAARFGLDGTVRQIFKIAGVSGEYRGSPDVAYSPHQDQYLVVYLYAPTVTSSDSDIRGVLVSGDGTLAGNEFPIRAEAGLQVAPSIAYNETHEEYLVVYGNSWASGLEDVAAQRVRASDGQLLSWRNIATGANQVRRLPDVAYNAARNEYLVVYEFLQGTAKQARGTRFTHDMATLFSEVTIGDPILSDGHTTVAAGPDEYLVVWPKHTSGQDYDVLARRVSGDGIPQASSAGFQIAGKETTTGYWDPAVAYWEGRSYLVAMASGPDYVNYTNTDVIGGTVWPGQDSVAGDLFSLFESSETQGYPQLACGPHGHCLAVEKVPVDLTGATKWAIRGRLLWACPRVYVPLVNRNH
jgi:hypothetical protein